MRKANFKLLLLGFSLASLVLTTLAGCVVYDHGPYGYYYGPGPYYYGYYRPGYSDYRNYRWRD
jgi:hypothetical protein